MADWKNVAIADLERQLAEARAETVAVRESWSDFADNIRQKELAAAEAELRQEREIEKEEKQKILNAIYDKGLYPSPVPDGNGEWHYELRRSE